LAEQSSLDHLKSRFFANISHEFRTPLTLIIGPIEDLLEDKNTYKFREQLKYIHRNSKRLLQLINQLLDLSRLDVGNYQVDTTREDLIPFVKQIVHSFSSMAQRKNILLETEVAPHLKNDLRNETSIFYFDEDIFEKILYNLLSNAFKFTPDGGSITVSISRAEKDLLELKVEDTGMGIPSEKLPYIFDRFYQADSSHKKLYEGTGIGLALVKELVELHQGEITVESILESGTTFSCYFPFNKKRLSPNNGTKTTASQNVIARGEEEKSDNEERVIIPGQPKVLVVEENNGFNSSYIIELDKVKSISMKKVYDSIKPEELRKKRLEEFLKTIHLQFEFKDGREAVALPFFEHKKNNIADLPLIERKTKNWKMIFSKMAGAEMNNIKDAASA